jgi:hypothetical protein
MTNKWDQAPEPTGSGKNFVTLKDGDKFVGQVVQEVEFVTIPAGQLPNQPADLVDIPQVIYRGVDGLEYEFTYTTTVLRNGIIRLGQAGNVEIGDWVFHHRIGKATGKTYVSAVIRPATAEETGANAPAKAKVQAAPTPAPKPVTDEPDF